MTQPTIFGTHDQNTLDQFQDVASRAVRSALMADGHLGYIMPVGGVAAYHNEVSVVGVGVDIGCGNCAIKTDMHLSYLGKTPAQIHTRLTWIADAIQKHISFGMGRSNLTADAPTDDMIFSVDAWRRLPEVAGNAAATSMRERARAQLGTVGGGNHYVDVFVDLHTGIIWVGVHFGSRGLGHNIASGFMAVGANQLWGERVKERELLLKLDTDLGDHYWHLMDLAGKYAGVGRMWVTRKVVQLLGAHEMDMVHNHHNFAWKEMHHVEGYDAPQELVVVRKGATPAFPGQRGFVGGSMGDISVILEGKRTHTSEQATALQEAAMFSTVHGAGRVMSRTEAKGKRNRKTGELKLDADGNPVKPPRVTSEMMTQWLAERNVILRGGDVDEAPHVYRRLPDVLAAQQDTITVLHTLTPLIVVMAGNDVHDPYKD